MRMIVNGEEKSFGKNLSVGLLVEEYKLKKEGVAVEVNQKIIKKADYEKCILKDGDKVEIVHFVGGG